MSILGGSHESDRVWCRPILKVAVVRFAKSDEDAMENREELFVIVDEINKFDDGRSGYPREVEALKSESSIQLHCFPR